MANYQEYRTDSGEVRHLALVRVKGFKRTSRAFATKRDAKEWAEGIEREFRAMRDRGGAQSDVGTRVWFHLHRRKIETALPVQKQMVYRVNEKTLARAFERLEYQNLLFESCQIEIGDVLAEAACSGSARYVPKVGSRTPKEEGRRWRFSLRKASGGWLIDRVDAR